MSRSRLLPLPGLQRRAAPAAAWLTFACPLAPGLGWAAALALLERLPAGSPPGTVILDLTGSGGMEDDDCAALCWLHERLAAARSRLWLAAPRPQGQLLRDRGVAGALGAGAVHPSRRAAILAIFAAQPGPGLVTSHVRLALAEPPVPLLAAAPGPMLPSPVTRPLPEGAAFPPGPESTPGAVSLHGPASPDSAASPHRPALPHGTAFPPGTTPAHSVASPHGPASAHGVASPQQEREQGRSGWWLLPLLPSR